MDSINVNKCVQSYRRNKPYTGELSNLNKVCHASQLCFELVNFVNIKLLNLKLKESGMKCLNIQKQTSLVVNLEMYDVLQILS